MNNPSHSQEYGEAGKEKSVEPIAVSLNVHPQMEGSFSRQERLQALRNATHDAKQAFIVWLKQVDPDIDLDSDIGPAGWQEGVLPSVVIKNRGAVIQLLRTANDLPPMVSCVTDIPQIVVPQISEDER